MTFKIEIDNRITDEKFMEDCLNLKASGYDPIIMIGFYALGKGWDYHKLMFLLEEISK